MGTNSRRRKYIVHPAQLRHLAFSLGILLFCTLAFSFVIFWRTAPFLGIKGRTSMEETFQAEALAKEFLFVASWVLPAFLLVMIGIGVWLVLFTHRVYGPMARLSRELQALASGQLPRPLRFRRTDHLPDVERRFNGVAERLTHILSQVQSARESLARHLQGQGSGTDLAAGVREGIQKLDDALAAYTADEPDTDPAP